MEGILKGIYKFKSSDGGKEQEESGRSCSAGGTIRTGSSQGPADPQREVRHRLRCLERHRATTSSAATRWPPPAGTASIRTETPKKVAWKRPRRGLKGPFIAASDNVRAVPSTRFASGSPAITSSRKGPTASVGATHGPLCGGTSRSTRNAPPTRRSKPLSRQGAFDRAKLPQALKDLGINPIRHAAADRLVGPLSPEKRERSADHVIGRRFFVSGRADGKPRLISSAEFERLAPRLVARICIATPRALVRASRRAWRAE